MPLGSSEVQGEGGVGPYKLAARRLRRNKTALAFGAMFLLIVILCLCAPLYAKHVAHTTPSANHITDTVDGKDVVSPGGIPTGPTWKGRFFLGADSNGRDVAVRLLYGGRNSLQIGFIATFISCFFATIVALTGGYFRGCARRRALADDGPDLGLPGDPAGHRARARRWPSAGSTSAYSRSTERPCGSRRSSSASSTSRTWRSPCAARC